VARRALSSAHCSGRWRGGNRADCIRRPAAHVSRQGRSRRRDIMALLRKLIPDWLAIIVVSKLVTSYFLLA
jgi:hypothetical protein